MICFMIYMIYTSINTGIKYYQSYMKARSTSALFSRWLISMTYLEHRLMYVGKICLCNPQQNQNLSLPVPCLSSVKEEWCTKVDAAMFACWRTSVMKIFPPLYPLWCPNIWNSSCHVWLYWCNPQSRMWVRNGWWSVNSSCVVFIISLCTWVVRGVCPHYMVADGAGW